MFLAWLVYNVSIPSSCKLCLPDSCDISRLAYILHEKWANDILAQRNTPQRHNLKLTKKTQNLTLKKLRLGVGLGLVLELGLGFVLVVYSAGQIFLVVPFVI